jgi:hypothetical protein
MQSRNSLSTNPLVQQIDLIIERHSNTLDPNVLRQLLDHRASLEQALNDGRKKDFAKIALQVASWIKFLFDFWPD